MEFDAHSDLVPFHELSEEDKRFFSQCTDADARATRAKQIRECRKVSRHSVHSKTFSPGITPRVQVR